MVTAMRCFRSSWPLRNRHPGFPVHPLLPGLPSGARHNAGFRETGQRFNRGAGSGIEGMSPQLTNGYRERAHVLDSIRMSLAQMTSTNRHEGNIGTLREFVSVADAEGCDLVALPEAAGMMNRQHAEALQLTSSEEDDPFICASRDLATRFGIWIHVGSTPIQVEGKLLNHSVLIDDSGAIRARYDKIHLFDFFLNGRASLESKRYDPGAEAVVVDTPWGPWGLSICYDIRFPKLYRDYANCGAKVIFVPSAFTVPTGKAHWEPLLRARAIENGCWIVASAQVGRHDDGRTTHGHSLVVSPWGEVVADLEDDAPCQRTLDLDLTLVESARQQIPSLQHDRPYRVVHVQDNGTASSVAIGVAEQSRRNR